MVSQLLELQSFAAMKILNYTCEDMVQAEGREELMQSLSSTAREEISMLQCFFINFTSTRRDPYENMDAFCDYVKTLIDFNVSKAQEVMLKES
ncbi:hypothetical protein Bca52824_003409 [Brassica carinata]|uniref:Uncharacterized protein n=1 Tax=Brassica carinata TaxID=52824 RepID=A0A8X8BBE9_BRACI|nr:hypothetical protein Bca52824_003409 [Brassica carinata]